MQNWKIKRMSVKRINLHLSAIGKLRRHYEGKAKVNRCPFCVMVPQQGCDICPWEIIEGTDCFAYACKVYGKAKTPSALRSNLRFKKWKVLRLGQLRVWKEIFKLELARREE